MNVVNKVRMQSDNGIFLTIEGVEGVGKSTAVKFIQRYLTQTEQDFIVTREPGGTEMAEKIRQILLAHSSETMAPITELLLMFACRAQHITNLILPALKSGKWVVSDRFVDASYAYQGKGRGFNENQIKILDAWVVGDLKPQATILLDAPPHIGLARTKRRGHHDRIEEEKIEFFEKVRSGYLERAQNDKARFHIIDATKPLAYVHDHIKLILDKLMVNAG